MNQQPSTQFAQFNLVYRHSLLTHLLGVTHYVYRRTRDELAKNKAYRKLSLNYQGFFTLLAERDYSPGELANRLLISKQACNKMLRELEQLKFICRRANPDDGRSRLVSLTAEGKLLLQCGGEATRKCLKDFSEVVGEQELEKLTELLDQLCRKLNIEIPYYRAVDAERRADYERGSARLNIFLNHLSNYCYQFLVDGLDEKGFHNLKVNFSQVLSMVGPDGAKIQDIAIAIGVSKQAIGVIVSELEQLGYIVRRPDPDDGRQLILWLTQQGERLIEESQSCIDALMITVNDCLAENDQQFLSKAMSAIFESVGGQHTPVPVSVSKIQELAEQLRSELGEVGARLLARHLVNN